MELSFEEPGLPRSPRLPGRQGWLTLGVAGLSASLASEAMRAHQGGDERIIHRSS